MELQLIASGTQNILKWCEGWALTVVAEVWKSWLVIPPTAARRRLTASVSLSKVGRKFDDSNLSGGGTSLDVAPWNLLSWKSKVKATTSWRCFDAQFSANCPPRMNPLVFTGPSSTLIQNMLSKVAAWSCRRWGQKAGGGGAMESLSWFN